MHIVELFLIAVGLSMDAFAVSICAGLTMRTVTVKKSLIIGLYFGIFQAGMPLIGYFAATLFADKIISYDHWVAFGLLLFLGGKMILDSLKKEETSDEVAGKESVKKEASEKEISKEEASLKPAAMLPLAVATSIDAMAVGVSFAFLKIDIIPAVSFIGITTLTLSMLGVKIGNVFGAKFKSQAGIAGGIILALIGTEILLEHIGILRL
jgi:putative Mn2+ efflux pump MntP